MAGKIVTNRRKQRLSAIPYHRHPPPKSPSWFTAVIIPSACALASGAGKILSSAVFSDSESSSSEDDHSVSDDDIDDINDHDIHCDGDNASDERKRTSSEIMQDGQEPQFGVQRTETKWIIEQLIRQETFSREECDRLINVLNSRVTGLSTQVGEKPLLELFPDKTVNHEDVDVFNKAVLEAKKWFQEKNVGSSSVAELAHGTCNLNSTALEHVESGSPVDVARSYMRDKPLWDSPKRHVGLRTPLTATTKLFKEGTPYSASSSPKRWSSVASGSWNIQEELRREAADDMLCSPPTKMDTGERIAKPIDLLMDVGFSYGPALVATESRQDDKASEAAVLSSDVANVSGNNEDREAIKVDGECGPSNVREAPAAEVAEFGGREYVNGFASLSTESTMVQIKQQTTRAKQSQAYMEIPETDNIAKDSENSLGLQYEEESSMEMTQPCRKASRGR